MRFLSTAVAILACCHITLGLPSSEKLSAKEELNALSERAAPYPSVSGLLFNIDGVTKYYVGTNAYWISFLTNNADVDLVMSHLQTAGLKILRVWGFNDITSPTTGVWFQSFIPGQPVQINTGANGLQRLDYVVQSAEAHGIKLIINFVNNWGDYGGENSYNSYFGTAANAWYTNPQIQAQYQTYIKAVVSRYLTSTAIFGWELANEPRCSGCDPNTIYNWAAATSKYIKSLDPNHMVGIGDEGFMASGGDGSYPYTIGAGGYDFVQNLNISTLAYGTLHLYPVSWGQVDSWGNQWITTHAAACVAANKPCLLEEYGTTTNKATTEGQWQTTALNSPGIAGDLFWQDGDVLSTGQTSDDGYTIYYGSSDWTALVTNHIAAINAKYPGGGSSPPPSSSSSSSSTPTTSSRTPTSTSSPPHTTTSSSPAGAGTPAPHWGQCGGIGYTGPTTCVAGTTCTYSNPYYSQCL